MIVAYGCRLCVCGGGGGGGKSGPLRQNECGIRRVVVDSKFQRGR